MLYRLVVTVETQLPYIYDSTPTLLNHTRVCDVYETFGLVVSLH